MRLVLMFLIVGSIEFFLFGTKIKRGLKEVSYQKHLFKKTLETSQLQVSCCLRFKY